MTSITLYNRTWMIYQLIQSNARTTLPIFVKSFSAVDTTTSGSILINVSSVSNQADYSGLSSPERASVWIPLKSKLF